MMSRRSLKVFHEAVIAQQINNLKQWIWAVMLASTILSATMQTGRSLESSQIQDCSSRKLSKAFHTSTVTVNAVRRELCFRKA